MNKTRGLSRRPGNFLYHLFYGVILFLILASRIYNLDSIPPGLFFDESSIGFNALSILNTGYDEHGAYLPLYFESVGDFKNPIYIYAVAGVFSIFTPSEFALRMTSVLFFGAALFCVLALVSRMFSNNRAVNLFALALFGFSPLFFVLSRISFEVISQLCLVSLFTLLVWLSFHGGEDNSRIPYAVAAGTVLGLSTYSYTTQRLLSFLMLAAVWAIYLRRNNLKSLLWLTASFSLLFIPFLLFVNGHPGVVTARFNDLSFIDDNLRLTEKFSMFVANYAAYWSPDFLVLHGDPNLRHSTGFGGVTYLSILVLFITGFLILVWRGKTVGKFPVFLIVNMFVSPIPAALISEGTPHALRSLLVVYYIFLISLYSLDAFTTAAHGPVIKTAILGVLVLFCGFEISSYLRDYFFFYPVRSVEAMDSFDFRSALEFALGQNPKEIIAAGLPPGGYAHVQFYSNIVSNPLNVPIIYGDFKEPVPGMCVLFNRRMDIESLLDKSQVPFVGFRSFSKLDPLDKWMHAEKIRGVIKVRCYQ